MQPTVRYLHILVQKMSGGGSASLGFTDYRGASRIRNTHPTLIGSP